MTKITRALISVSDKTGIEPLARALVARSVTILSTGGTARVLRDAGIEVTEVSEVTGFPEIMDGRVKTLHPRIHGGLLGRRGTDDGVMEEHGIPAIDLLVVNLYPFEETVADPNCSRQRAVENIDVGGPAMLRAAAKNHDHVTVLVDPGDYQDLIEELDASDGSPSQSSRERLAAKAFAHTAAYDAAIAAYLREDDDDREMPARLVLTGARVMDLRYGENPHQEAALYRLGAVRRGTVIGSEQIQGKPLSYNNLADAEAALETVRQFEAPACVVVKHANPCGVAVGDDPAAAYRRAFASDPVSAFGGIIAFNRPLEAAAAHEILDRQFVEVVVAPEFASDAVEAFQVKPSVRLLACGPLHGEDEAATAREFEYKRLRGGLLVQEADAGTIGLDELEVVTREAPDQTQLKDLMFAWKVAKFVKSNAIVYARAGQTLGIGAGQMSRVDSARIALLKAQDAGLSVKGSAMASDAFFPFRDSVDSAAEAGVAAIIQPGGSIRDKEVIAAADEHGIAMVFTGMRHFRH